jgi:hypothetical protein
MRFLVLTRRLSLFFVLGVAAVALRVGGAGAFPSEFNNCTLSGCHTNDSATCNGCHHHRGSLTATRDQSQYFPGQTVTVTLNGGTQSGWIRGLLYDADNVEIARRSGPTGTGDDGGTNDVVFPVQLQAPAPPTPGTYVWQAAWFGNWNDGGSVHQEQRVNVTITVVADQSDVTGEDEGTYFSKTWSRIKEKFAR